ncbi:ArsR/SmtB family transcription factor [Gemmatimonas sp.]
MVQFSSAQLDLAFAALSDGTRRGVLEQLGGADASISDLADQFRMTLTGMKKHVGILEDAGLVETAKIGRVRMCRLGPQRLADVNRWLERYRQMWEARFAQLDDVLNELQLQENRHARRSTR